jgi:hypothetical protein
MSAPVDLAFGASARPLPDFAAMQHKAAPQDAVVRSRGGIGCRDGVIVGGNDGVVPWQLAKSRAGARQEV